MNAVWVDMLCYDAIQTSPQCLLQRFGPSIFIQPPDSCISHTDFSSGDKK